MYDLVAGAGVVTGQDATLPATRRPACSTHNRCRVALVPRMMNVRSLQWREKRPGARVLPAAAEKITRRALFPVKWRFGNMVLCNFILFVPLMSDFLLAERARRICVSGGGSPGTGGGGERHVCQRTHACRDTAHGLTRAGRAGRLPSVLERRPSVSRALAPGCGVLRNGRWNIVAVAVSWRVSRRVSTLIGMTVVAVVSGESVASRRFGLEARVPRGIRDRRGRGRELVQNRRRARCDQHQHQHQHQRRERGQP